MIRNAEYALEHHSAALSGAVTPAVLHRTASDLLPRAQRTTAGFVAFFLSQWGVA